MLALLSIFSDLLIHFANQNVDLMELTLKGRVCFSYSKALCYILQTVLIIFLAYRPFSHCVKTVTRFNTRFAKSLRPKSICLLHVLKGLISITSGVEAEGDIVDCIPFEDSCIV